jgi:hypothetical protein
MKTAIALLIAAPLTIVAAEEAEQLLYALAPEAATTVSDISLTSIYNEVFAMVNIHDVPIEEALHRVAEDFSEEGIVYSVEGGELTVRTDWSCRRLVTDGLAFKTVDC